MSDVGRDQPASSTRASATPDGPRKRRDLVENEIFERATALFAERGFAGTSLQDIADAMGMTRPALYYYVKNKDEILSRLVAQITEGPAKQLAALNADEAKAPLDRLRSMARAVVLGTARDPSRFRLLIRSESELSPELAAVYARGRRKVLAEFVSVIEDGMRRGEIRPVDARIAALGVLGLCNWVAWWYHPKDAKDADDVANRLSEMAVLSVAQPEDRRVDSVASAIDRLREDLDQLEHLAAPRSRPAEPASSPPRKKKR